MGGGGDNEVKETEHERALAETALGRYQRYMTKFKPFENQFIADVTGPTGAKENRMAGQINADLAQKVTALPGGDPSRRGGNSFALQGGQVAAKSQVQGAGAVRDQRIQGLQAAIDIGNGQASSAQLGLTGLAKGSVNEAIGNAENSFNSRNAWADTAGSVAGAIAASYNQPKKKG